ncbi:HET-domain-containing protein [Apiospora sp. TS-2023a]
MESLNGAPTIGDKSTSTINPCPTCGDDLSDPYPDFATLAHTCRDKLLPEALRESAGSGCKFCSIILGVWDDCQEQFDCALSPYYSVVEHLDGIKVRIYSVGQNYLLALEPIWMPIHHDPGNTSHWDPVLYVALSNCWGETQPLKTTTANVQKHEQGILFEDFPLTFRDAIQTARNLGYSCIWIDSICIIQNNREDWIHESSLMASVYNGADLVIAASVSAGANDGFLRERIPYPEGTVTIGTDPKWSGNTYTYRLVVDPELRWPINPLHKRAWAYQEHVCAKRYLSFEHGEIVWDCCQKSSCESGWVSTTTTHDATSVCCFDRIARDEPTKAIHGLWRTTVRKYSLMNLSYNEDRFVALSAIASRFQSVLNSTYLAGLWKEDLIRDLMWYYTSSATIQTFYAPSWSWFSIDDFWVAWMGNELSGETLYEAEVLNGTVSVSTSNPFGPVHSGSITLRALHSVTRLYRRFSSHETESSLEQDPSASAPSSAGSPDAGSSLTDQSEYERERLLIISKDSHFVTLDTYLQPVILEDTFAARRVCSSEDYFDNARVAEQLENGGIDVWLIILASTFSPPPRNEEACSIGLILGPLTASADVFQRIGLFRWHGKPDMSETGAWKTRDVVIH